MPELKPEAERVCLFGGTFDPIHSAHLRIAGEACRQFSLDRVLFIPAGQPPHKAASELTPFEDRYRMVEMACEPFPRFGPSRAEEGHAPSYTINTIRRFKEEAAPGTEFFFLIGSDAFDEIETWKDWRELILEIDFIVVARPGRSYNIPSGSRVHRLEKLELPVSSSDIRGRLAQGEPTSELPANVRAYIEQRGLYRTRNDVTAIF